MKKEKDTQYHLSGTRLFQLRHLLVLFAVLIIFQIIVTNIHKLSLQDLLDKTQNWYQKDSAEKMANLTATSLELLIDNSFPEKNISPEKKGKTIQAFNIILSQQLLQNSVEDICLIYQVGDKIYAIDNGQDLYALANRNLNIKTMDVSKAHRESIVKYLLMKEDIKHNEEITTIREGEQTFHVFVPFVPRGEFRGALYLKYQSDFSFITDEMIKRFDEIAIIFISLIFFGLLTMFFISSYTLSERDKAGNLLIEERAKNVAEKITHEKEALFTKRIYHTHHKAEKVMGFIKEDLRSLNKDNIESTKENIVKYSNFVSRVIYDMKWYDPPLQTIRNPIFKTDLNSVLQFIVKNIFERVSRKVESHKFELILDKNLPPVPINEFVVWEILEPLIQNATEHSGEKDIIITITTQYNKDSNSGLFTIADNGKGFDADLLELGDNGIKKIFQENISKKTNHPNSGYGCYLAYEISVRCNWLIDAENLPAGGCQFTLTINY